MHTFWRISTPFINNSKFRIEIGDEAYLPLTWAKTPRGTLKWLIIKSFSSWSNTLTSLFTKKSVIQHFHVILEVSYCILYSVECEYYITADIFSRKSQWSCASASPMIGAEIQIFTIQIEGATVLLISTRLKMHKSVSRGRYFCFSHRYLT